MFETRGYRTVFVNGHDLASRIRLPNGPDVPGDVRIAAIAVKDGRKNLHFEVALEAEMEATARFRQMHSRGYHLSNLTSFTDGTSPFVLAIYTEAAQHAGILYPRSGEFPVP